MTPTRIAFLALAGAILILGLFVVAAARELPLAIFGWGLILFGAFFAFTRVKETMDDEDRARH